MALWRFKSARNEIEDGLQNEEYRKQAHRHDSKPFAL
jgi:hypothetical protein